MHWQSLGRHRSTFLHKQLYCRRLSPTFAVPNCTRVDGCRPDWTAFLQEVGEQHPGCRWACSLGTATLCIVPFVLPCCCTGKCWPSVRYRWSCIPSSKRTPPTHHHHQHPHTYAYPLHSLHCSASVLFCGSKPLSQQVRVACARASTQKLPAHLPVGMVTKLASSRRAGCQFNFRHEAI